MEIKVNGVVYTCDPNKLDSLLGGQVNSMWMEDAYNPGMGCWFENDDD